MVLRRNRLARAATQSPELVVTFARIAGCGKNYPFGLGHPQSPARGEVASTGGEAFLPR